MFFGRPNALCAQISVFEECCNIRRDVAIVNAVINLAQALRLRVIAEGVETAAQRAYLLACGCERYQGWLYAAAMPRVAFEGWVRERQPAVLDAV